MTPQQKQPIIKEAVKVASEALHAAFVLCELKDKIACTIDFEQAGEAVRFKISFEKIETR